MSSGISPLVPPAEAQWLARIENAKPKRSKSKPGPYRGAPLGQHPEFCSLFCQPCRGTSYPFYRRRSAVSAFSEVRRVRDLQLWQVAVRETSTKRERSHDRLPNPSSLPIMPRQ